MNLKWYAVPGEFISNYKSLFYPPTFKLIHLFTECEEKHFLTFFFFFHRHQPFQVCFLTAVVWCSQVVLLAVGICLQVSSLKTQHTTLWAFWQLTRAFNLLSEIGCRNLCDTNRRNLLEVSAEWLIINMVSFFYLSRHFDTINSDLTAIMVSTKLRKVYCSIVLLSLGRFALESSTKLSTNNKVIPKRGKSLSLEQILSRKYWTNCSDDIK